MSGIIHKWAPTLRELGMTLDQINDVRDRWLEPWRFYHTIEHLENIMEEIDLLDDIDKEDKNILRVAAIFHDVVYNPLDIADGNNERNSYELFELYCKDASKEFKNKVKKIIDATSSRKKPKDKLAKLFWLADNTIIYDSTFEELLEWEEKIFKEFQAVPYKIYREKRIAFLESTLALGDARQNADIARLIHFIKNRRLRIGIYPGSFNPFHKGHLNILEKAEEIFDKVIIARGINPSKMHIERKWEIPRHVAYRQYDVFTSLLTDYIETQEDERIEVVLVRGLRNGHDLAYETNQNFFNRKLKPDLKVVYLHCDKEFENISSSMIRDIDYMGEVKAKKLAQEYLV